MLLGGVSLALAPACKQGQVEPEFASSTDQPSYAKRHPAQLKAALENLDGQVTLVETLSGELKQFPDRLKDPDWKSVADIVEQADREGRSSHYAKALEENGQVAAFYAEEKPELHKQVGGAVQYHAKNKGCNEDMYSPAAHALDKGMSKRLEERTRGQSEAHSFIAMNESSLGKANLEALEQQADQIALASYVSHIGLVRKKQELEQLLSDASAVEGTLDDRIKELSETPASDKQSARQAKAREDELNELKAARELLASELEPARKQAEQVQQRIDQAQKTYLEALKQLQDDIEKRAEQAPKQAEK